MSTTLRWIRQNLMCPHSFKRRARSFTQSDNGRYYTVCVACAVCGKQLSPGIDMELMSGRVKLGARVA